MADFFWLSEYLQNWQIMQQSGVNPHAVIINGAQGIGKSVLLQDMLKPMLCNNPLQKPCGECQSCRLHSAGSHPDVLSIEPENQLIKVGMIRQLTEFFTSTPHSSAYKIAIINQAHLMNVAASNALLKVLEEPPSSGHLFLLSEAKHRLLPTILSRCISMNLQLPAANREAVVQWLVEQGQTESEVRTVLPLFEYVPLRTLAFLEQGQWAVFQSLLDDLSAVVTQQISVVEAAKKWAEVLNLELIGLLQQYLLNQTKSQLLADSNESQVKFYPKFTNRQQTVDYLLKIADLLGRIVLNFNTQLKKQLMIEAFLIELKQQR